jgi:pilus assembly protein Flp/PilA
MLYQLVAQSLRRLEELRTHEGGQGLVEYSLILLLVSVVSIAILTILGTDVRNVFSSVVQAL